MKYANLGRTQVPACTVPTQVYPDPRSTSRRSTKDKVHVSRAGPTGYGANSIKSNIDILNAPGLVCNSTIELGMNTLR